MNSIISVTIESKVVRWDPHIKIMYSLTKCQQSYLKQESIPVGCLPPVFLIPGADLPPPPEGRPYPQEGTWDQAARQEMTPYLSGQTTTENIIGNNCCAVTCLSN